MVVLWVHRHVRCDVVVEQPKVEVSVAIVDEQQVGMLAHLVEAVRIVH